jgi:hypothetical protein
VHTYQTELTSKPPSNSKVLYQSKEKEIRVDEQSNLQQIVSGRSSKKELPNVTGGGLTSYNSIHDFTGVMNIKPNELGNNFRTLQISARDQKESFNMKLPSSDQKGTDQQTTERSLGNAVPKNQNEEMNFGMMMTLGKDTYSNKNYNEEAGIEEHVL